MSFASAGTLTVDRFSSSNVRQVVGTGSGFDGFVDAFGSDVVSYWKFANTGVDEKGTANASISGVPEFNIPSIVTPDRVGEGASADGEVLAWPGTAGEYAQVAHTAAHKTLEATIVVHFQCDTLNDTSTLIAANATPAQPGELVILINSNGSPQANLRNSAGAPVVLAGVAGDVVVGRAYAIVVKHGAAGFSMALYNDAFQLVRRATNPLATGQAASLSPIRFGAYHTDVDHHDGPYGRVVWLRRRITDAEELLLAKPRTVAHGAPPGGTYDDAPITSRNPKLYLPLEQVSGSPIDAAGAGYAGSLQMIGTPIAYEIETQKGKGIRLGINAYIQAGHHSVFTTTAADTPHATYGVNVIVESEVTFSIHCAFPAALQDNWVIFSKANDFNSTAPGVVLQVMQDGSVELLVREHKLRSIVRMATMAGLVTQGSEHHFTVSLGYQGAWFTVDGRQAELGFKNHLAWWGLDHRWNGIEETGGPAAANLSTRYTNTSAIRLGRSGEQTLSADIVVTKFAVFHSGMTRVARGQLTPGFTLAACQALAGASGAVLPDPKFGTLTQTAPAGLNQIQAAINAMNSAGGGTVILNGSYSQSVSLILRSRVRLTTTSSATITLTGAAQVTTPIPSAMPGLASVALAPGQLTYAASNTLSNDAIFVVCSNNTVPMGSLWGVPSSNVQNINFLKSEMIPIRSRTAGLITFTRGPHFNFPTAVRFATRAYEPTVDIAIDGNITINKTETRVASPPVAAPVAIDGVRRARFNGLTMTLDPGSAAVVSVIGMYVNGSTEVRFNGCNFTDNVKQGADSTFHPYGLKFTGSSHYDVFAHTGHSDDWHAIDNEGGNPDDDWGIGSSIGTAQYSGQYGDIRNSTLSTDLGGTGGGMFPCICHTSNHITFLDLLWPSGGALDVNGWGHSMEAITASAGGNNTVLSFARGAGGTRFAHLTFNNNIGGWGRGSNGIRRSSFVNCHYANAPSTSTLSPAPGDGSCHFLASDSATNGMPTSLA
jgi:hypothetical protein